MAAGVPHRPSPRLVVLPAFRRGACLACAAALAAVGLLATPASPLVAQATPPEETIAAAVRPGEIVRARLRGGAAWEGDFAGTRDGRILLAGGRDTVALEVEEVAGLWVRERRTRTGARRGALLGGGVGLAVSGFFAVLFSAMGSSDSTADSTLDDAVGLVVAGTALGAGTGAALGGSLGAAATGWRQVVPADRDVRAAVPRVVTPVGETPSRAEAAVPTRRRFGALDGAVSFGRLADSGGSTGGVGARLALLAELRYGGEDGGPRRLVAFGPELELQGVGSADAARLVFPDCLGQPGCPPPVEEKVRESYRAGAVRALVRVGPETDSWRAYGLLGAGVLGWRTPARDDEGREYGGSWRTHPAGVAGAGVQLRPGTGPFSVGVEGRLNRVVLSGDSDPGTFWTAGLTVNTSL